MPGDDAADAQAERALRVLRESPVDRSVLVADAYRATAAALGLIAD